MSNYNDYKKESFFVEKRGERKRYFIKVRGKYVEVTEDVFKTCKNSYQKIRYEHQMEVDCLKSMNNSFSVFTSFFFDYEKDLINSIYLMDLTKIIISYINSLSDDERKIASLIFLEEMSIREVAELLNIPKSTVSYKKAKIQKLLQKYLKNVGHF